MKTRDYEKVWNKLKELLLEQYPYEKRVAEFSSGEFEYGVLEKTEQILNCMDKLDDTYEFSNLKDDLERGNE